jgi:hypothetical protein
MIYLIEDDGGSIIRTKGYGDSLSGRILFQGRSEWQEFDLAPDSSSWMLYHEVSEEEALEWIAEHDKRIATQG